jgi:AICAR transformylase/IMP cyclohydrolase PurH
MHRMKDQLEDLAFAELHPDARASIVARLGFLREKGGDIVARIVAELKATLAADGLAASVSGREKSPYSIWRKMERKNVSFEQLADVMAFRILVDGERRRDVDARHYKRVHGGLLVQDPDTDIEDREGWQVVAGAPSEKQWGDLVFAWRVCKHVLSNAIVIVKDLQTIGIGAGQMSRVDAVNIAVEKARAQGHDLNDAVLASDAFFPFPDGPRIALDAGVSSIVQPGGSRRDQDVIDAVEKAGAAMVFTGRRHFRH